MPGSSGTNVTGQCALCGQFFGKKVHEIREPKETKLDKEIVKKDGAPSGMSSLTDNPDNKPVSLISAIPSKRSARRRRRRTQN
jgi:hypothetical protein